MSANRVVTCKCGHMHKDGKCSECGLDNPYFIEPRTDWTPSDKRVLNSIVDALAQDGPVAQVWKSDRQMARRYLVALVVGYLMSQLDAGNGQVDGTIAAAFELGRIAERESWQRHIKIQ